MRRFSSSIKSQYTTSFQRLWSIVAILLMLVSNFGPMAATTKALAKAPSNTSGAVPAVKAETTSMALAPERLNVSQPERTIKSIEPVQKQYTGRQTTGNYGPPDNTQVLSLEPTSWGGGVCWPYCYDNTQIFHMNCAFEDDAHTVVFCTGYFEYNFYNGIVGGAASFDVYVVPFPSWNEPSWSNIPTVYYYQFRSSPNLNGKISTMCDHNCDNYGHYMKPSEEGTFYDEDPGGRYHVVALNLFYDNPPCPAGSGWPCMRNTGYFSYRVSLHPLNQVPPESVFCLACSAYAQTMAEAGEGINTSNGAYHQSTSDLSVPTGAGEMKFQREYNSQAKSQFAGPLGPGWTHNQDIRLVFPDDPAGEAGYVLFKSPSGNLYRFIDKGDGTYQAYPGYPATLTRSASSPYVYTLTDASKSVFAFDENGRVQTQTDAAGRTFSYNYNQNGRLSQVSADGGTRYLQFNYNTSGKLLSVGDQSGQRQVSYTYNTDGNLDTATDVVGQDWHYSYDSASDLTEIRDPNNAVLIHNNYAKPVVTSVDFNDQTIDDYDLTTHPNNPGTASIEDDGQTLHMVGDSWKKVSLPYDVTNRTILEFDFKSTNEGALHAIGFDKDDSVDWSQLFKLYGTEHLGNTDYNNYASTVPGWKHYKIRLERIPHTSASSLVFINNDPSENATVESDFSNIKIYGNCSGWNGEMMLKN